MRPVRYKIHMEPDLETFRFSGCVDIEIEIPESADEIILNALDLAVWRCAVGSRDAFVDCPYCLDPAKQTLTVALPAQMSGAVVVRCHYEGRINDKMAGFYRSHYRTESGGGFAAVTQFQESDARRAFPCFDHPEKKATFEIELIISETLTAVSNSPAAREEALGNGKKRVVFEPTPVMSTYLVFIGVGPFEWIEDRGDILVRVAAMPGMSQYGRFGLDSGRKALSYCRDYYAIAYPFAKLDLIAIEDFAFGAMENWGAITFRENLLLYFPETTSASGKQRIFEVIAHEMAHQWFGDLVTPSDWKYLWLNESFATFFGYGVMDHYFPEWDVWEQFLYMETATAQQRDGLHETFPIEIPGGEHVVINTSTAPIIYNKGAGVLRQVEGYIGKDAFRQGVRHYLRKHAYACASSEDLWHAFEEASQVPVSRMMQSWVYEPGHPVVDVTRRDGQLLFNQKRFTFLPNTSGQRWIIPIVVQVRYRDGRNETLKTLMETGSAVLDLPAGKPDWYKVNAGQTGFYRVTYQEKENLEKLGAQVFGQGISPEDRWGLQGDLYAQVMSGDVSLKDYMEFLFWYRGEKAFLPLAGIAQNLFHAYLVTDASAKDKVATAGRAFIEGVLSKIGYAPSPEDRQTIAILRDQALWQGMLYDSEAVACRASERFASMMKGEPIHPDVARSVMQAGALKGDDEVFSWLDRRLQSSQSEHERMNVLTAVGSFGKKALLEKARDYVFHHVPDRNKFVPLCTMAANPRAIPFVWDWFLADLKALESFHPIHFERVIAAVVPVGGLTRAEEVKSFFADYLKKNDRLKDVVALSLEKLEVNLRMRRLSSA